MDEPYNQSRLVPVPHEVVDTRGLEPEEALAIARSVLAKTYDLILPDEVPELSFRGEVWSVGSLIFGTHESDEHTLARTPRHLISNPGAYLKLQIFDSVGGRIEGDGWAAELAPGYVHFIDQSRPYLQTVARGRHATVFVPHGALSFRRNEDEPYFALGTEDPAGRMLRRTLLGAFEDLPRLNVAEAGVFEAALLDVLRSLQQRRSRQQAPATSNDSRRARAIAYIDRQLSDPSLDPALVADAAGVSRATLFRDFVEFGGVEAYIRGRRLERAFRMLAKSAPKRGVILSVAEMCGFSASSDFSSAFKRRFGRTPSSVMGRWYRPEKESPPIDARDHAEDFISSTFFV